MYIQNPKMLISEFCEDFLNNLMKKLSKENKVIYLMGDFNINLLNYQLDNHTAKFLDNICSSGFFPYINISTRIASRSKTLIDNIYHNNLKENTYSGNLATDISDHLAQFLLIPTDETNKFLPKQIFIRDYKNFEKENFETEIKRENWKHTLGLHLKDVNHSFEKFLEMVNNALDKHAPYRRMSRKEQKTAAKPCITKGIRKPIQIKNYLKKKSCKTKDSTKKAELDEN